MTSTIICPACGGLAELHTQPYRPFGVEYGETIEYRVKCPICGRCGGPGIAGHNVIGPPTTKEKAQQIAVDRFTYREYYDRWRALERVLYMQRAQLLQKDLNQLRSNS